MIEKHETVNDHIYLSLFTIVNIKRNMRRIYSRIIVTTLRVHDKLRSPLIKNWNYSFLMFLQISLLNDYYMNIYLIEITI